MTALHAWEHQAFLEAHPDVYERSGGTVRLKIRAGRIDLASLACNGLRQRRPAPLREGGGSAGAELKGS